MIKTERLGLIPLEHEHLLLYKNDAATLAQILNLNYQPSQNDPATEADHTEAIEFWITLLALCKWGFSHPNLLSIIADTPAQHMASQKVLIKSGFCETGRSTDIIHWQKVR